MADAVPEDWYTSNPFALAATCQASEHRHIVAARDIVDERASCPVRSMKRGQGRVVRLAATESPPTGPAKVSAAKLQQLSNALEDLRRTASDLAVGQRADVARVGARAVHRLDRLRLAGHGMGLWQGGADADTSPGERFDLDLAMREVQHRLRTLPRDWLWPETDAALLDDHALASLWLQLEGHLITVS